MAELKLRGAKGDVSIPGKSPEELALQQKQAAAIDLQTKAAEKQSAEQEALAPYLYESMGLKKVTAPDGKVSFTKMTPEEQQAQMSPDQLQSSEIQKKANARVLAALEGNLNVDPSVEADLSRSEGQLREELMRKLGPGAEGSDSWNRAMQEFNRQAGSLRYSVRHGEMTSADALASNRTNELMARQTQALNNLKGATDPYTTNAAVLSGVADTAGRAMAPMQQERFSAADMAMKGSQTRNAFWGNVISSGATLGAAGLAGACWIAEVLYGKDAWRTHLLRFWITNIWAQTSPIGALVAALYRRYGKQAAAWLTAHPRAQPPVRWLFDQLVSRAISETALGGLRHAQAR